MFIWFIIACDTGSNNTFSFGEPESCSINTDCPRGMLCIQEQCVQTDCLTSSDCPHNKYCSELRKCKKGCESNSDCKSGSICNDEGKCEEYTCRDTELDCQPGEYCLENGCQPTNFPICEPCDYYDFFADINGGVCAIVDVVEHLSCEWDTIQQRPLSSCPENLKCLPSQFVGFQDGGGICAETLHLKTCSVDTPCPRGFQCYDNIFRSSDPQNQVAACLGNCEFYVDEGYLP